MIEITHPSGVKLRARALEGGILRVQAGGFDGYEESLLERYGLVRALDEAGDAVESERTIETPEGGRLSLNDDLGFALTKRGTELTRALSGTRVAGAPTAAANPGFRLELPIVDGERFVGFGDFQRERFLLNGMQDTLWIEYPVKHVPVPLLLSSRGYGVFFNTTRKIHFDIGVEDPEVAAFGVERQALDIFLFTGNDYDELIDTYCLLTGRPKLPPIKSLGLWLIMHTRATGHDVLTFTKTLRDERIPCDNISLEPDWMQERYDASTGKEWNAERFRGTPHGSWFRAGPNRMINALNRMGFDLGLWLCCRYDFTWEEERRRISSVSDARSGETSAAAAAPADSARGGAGGGVDAAGSSDADGTGEAELNDAATFLPGARRHGKEPEERTGHAPIYLDNNTKRDEPWFEHLKKFVDDGVRFFKMDPAVLINEFPDRLYGNGRHDDEMHNIAFLLSSKQMSDDYEAYTGRRSYGIAVAGWAGLQRYPGTWAGDTGGGAGPMVGILQDAVVGHTFATCDMNTTDVAGLHMGFLLPWSLINSWASFHYPGYQGEEMDEAYRFYSGLRMSLLPYLYGLCDRASRTGKAMARPFFLEWPEVETAYELTKHYLLGDSLLVTVYTDELTLPEGRWFDYFSDQVLEGDWQSRPAPISPGRGGCLFVREGGIIPTIEVMQHADEKPITEITWRLFPGAEPATFTLYLDAGDGLAYREGAFARATLTCTPTQSGVRLEWSDVEGNEPERITGLTHTFEILGRTMLSSVTVGGRSVAPAPDKAGNRVAVGPVSGREEIVVDW